MNMHRQAFWRNALGALLAVAWALSSYLAGAGIGPVDLRVAVAVAPMLLALILTAWQSPLRRPLALALLALALAATFGAWPWLRGHVVWLLCLQHLGVHLALAAWFGLSLAATREPVITSMARAIHGRPPTPQALRYTRAVTWMWTLFFLGNAAVSMLLFAWAPLDIWSVHANLLTGPLVAMVFLGEVLVRRRVLPREERPSLRQVVRSYRAHNERRGVAAESGVTRP